MRFARAVIVIFSVLAGAWFILGIRQAHEISQATAIVNQSSTPTAAESARAASLLRSAGTLNPDREVELLRAALALDQNNFQGARRILEAVVRNEPMNVEAWALLATAAGSDPRLEREALNHVAQLHPGLHGGQ